MRLTQEEIFYMTKFDSFIGAMAKDCVIDGNVVAFLLKPSDIGKAIGRNGSKVKMLAKHFGKKIEIFALHEKVEEFIRGAFPDITFNSIEIKGKTIIAKLDSNERRKFMEYMGRFKRIKRFLGRNYNIEEIRF